MTTALSVSQPVPRVLVVGLGAIGGLVMGGLLSHPSGVVDVVGLSTNPTIATALTADGFRLGGVRTPSVTRGLVVGSVDKVDGLFAYILIALQPPHAADAVRSLVHLLAPDGVFVLLQNGLPEDIIGGMVGMDRVIGAVVTWGASQDGPGVFLQTSPGGFILGRPNGLVDPTLQRLSTLLKPVGKSLLTDNIVGARWSKLAINASISTLGTIGGDTLGRLMRSALVRRLFLEIVSETVAVAQASGVRLAPVSRALDLSRLALTPAERRGGLRLWPKHTALLVVGLRYRRMRSSMLAAIERGRPAAVDFLNGEVVRRGAALGVPTPVNTHATALVHAIARGEARSGMALIHQLATQVGLR